MLILARWHLYTETVPCQCYDLKMLAIHLNVTGISLGMHPANERRRYSVTTSLISWAHTYTDPCCKLVCYVSSLPVTVTLTSRERHGVANHRQFECLFNSLFRLYQRKHSPKKGSVMRNRSYNYYLPNPCHKYNHLGPLLLTWFNFNPSMDK